jgi:hypothetical protein
MLEGDIDGMESAEAAAEGDKMGVLIFLADQWNDFVDEIVVVLDVAGDAPTGRNLLVVPALHVDRVNAVELELAGIDFASERADHVAIFKFVEAAARGRKHDDR